MLISGPKSTLEVERNKKGTNAIKPITDNDI